MYVYLSGCLSDYIFGLVLDDVMRNHRSGDGGDAEDIYPGWTRRRRVIGIRTVPGNTVTDDDVVVEILARCMAMHGHARQAIACYSIVDYQVAVGLCARDGIENTDARTGSCNGKPIIK